MRPIIALLAASFVLFTQLSFAYHLPKYTITEWERQVPAEDVLSVYRAKLENISRSRSFFKLREHSLNSKVALKADERKLYKEYRSAETAERFWNYVADLKKALLNLDGASSDPAVLTEADTISKTVVETLYSLSQKYKAGSSAYLNNVMINMGFKKEGFCYHYVGELKRALSKREWKFFDISWGGSREGTMRENNGLVITAKGKTFETGIVIDAWRKTGRPFWTKVKGDRYRWVKSDYDWRSTVSTEQSPAGNN